MLLLLFQIALVFILVHAVITAYQLFRAQNWFEFVYQLAIAVAALYFLFNQFPI
ncbi:hypothetical protein [Laceyella putida]|uniref:Uncharacterized protein n=1 Tax=Laceyella putida TaxID=110101 RepID=A0ABW2RKF0_9BACL